MRRDRIFTQYFQRFKAVDAGQIDVHQDHIRLRCARDLDADVSVHRSHQADIEVARDDLLDQHQVGRIIFHIEQGA